MNQLRNLLPPQLFGRFLPPRLPVERIHVDYGEPQALAQRRCKRGFPRASGSDNEDFLHTALVLLNTSASASHAAFGYMSNYTLQMEGVKMPSEGCARAFNGSDLSGDHALY